MSNQSECWLIIRIYRDRKRVLSMHEAWPLANEAFKRATADLRDGDVILAHASYSTIQGQSGGYNRTRW